MARPPSRTPSSRSSRARQGRGGQGRGGQGGGGHAAGRPSGRATRGAAPDSVWLFGLHAVRDALANPRRRRRRLIVTPNARQRLAEAIAAAGIEPEIADPRKFPAPLDPQSVHQGAALEAEPLDWGPLETLCAPTPEHPAPLVVLLDRVTDPHNVGAILRSAEVFGARAVIAPRRHAAPETGALAKAASGALERQPYLRVANLGDAMERLAGLDYALVGLAGEAETPLDAALAGTAECPPRRPLGLVLGAEGAGLRPRTRSLCTALARITPAPGAGIGAETGAEFASLNVSTAAAVALYAASGRT